jgi:hypothetical protein
MPHRLNVPILLLLGAAVLRAKIPQPSPQQPPSTRLIPSDVADQQRFESCYPQSQLAVKLLERLREERTLDALDDLVAYLRGVREERKAIVTISDGWRLFTPDQSLKAPVGREVPGTPEVGVDPRSGRLTQKPPPRTTSTYERDRDRLRLADLDYALEFRQLLDEVNRANASFYTMDPRGPHQRDRADGRHPACHACRRCADVRGRHSGTCGR